MNIKIFLTVFTILIFTSFQASSAAELSAGEIKNLIVGKTVAAEHLKKDFTFKVYFSPDGTAIRNKDDDIVEGTYTIESNMHCVNFGNGDKCATINSNGDGSYDRFKGGDSDKNFIRWSTFTDGKHL